MWVYDCFVGKMMGCRLGISSGAYYTAIPGCVLQLATGISICIGFNPSDIKYQVPFYTTWLHENGIFIGLNPLNIKYQVPCYTTWLHENGT